MILLDTHVLPALMLKQPDPSVVAWLDRQPAESIWLTSITLFEARYGLALLPSGQRKREIAWPPGGHAGHLYCRHRALAQGHTGHQKRAAF